MSGIEIINDVSGIEGRKNTVLHHPPTGQPTEFENNSQHQVIFFPGDIQDLASFMVNNYACKDYVEWSYEATLKLLSVKFPACHLWLIKPSKKAYNCVCIYQNFVESESLMGVPLHSVNFNGFKHLELLIKNASLQLKLPEQNQKTILVAFSKGCVVLNQVFYELSDYKFQSPLISSSADRFVKSLAAMVWLDGGHSGEEGVWITDSEIIDAFVDLKLNILFSLFVTPYQVKDEHRPWKGEEMKQFVKLLKEKQINLNEELYFENEKKSIENHFKILSEFDSTSILRSLTS